MNSFEVLIPPREIEVHKNQLSEKLSGTVVDFLRTPIDGANFIANAIGRGVEMNTTFMPEISGKVNLTGCFFRPFVYEGNGLASCSDWRILPPTRENFTVGRKRMFTTAYFEDEVMKDATQAYVPTGAYTAVQANRKYTATALVCERLGKYVQEHDGNRPINAIIPLMLYSTPIDKVSLYGIVYGLPNGYIRQSDRLLQLLSKPDFAPALLDEALSYGNALAFLHRSTRLCHGQPTLSNVAKSDNGQTLFLDWATSRDLDDMSSQDQYLNMATDVGVASTTFGALLRSRQAPNQKTMTNITKANQVWADYVCRGYLKADDAQMAKRNMKLVAALPSINYPEDRIRGLSKLIADRYPATQT